MTFCMLFFNGMYIFLQTQLYNKRDEYTEYAEFTKSKHPYYRRP